ncbi:hypothetical protein [Spirosoma taeanense]|uniref:hypothetical protein n=1 Tax=Spirosoma taeanense TaxID=2735870 RepID=UPI001F043164|nr:hypothetical protein [Spirosoma taeanense]
MLVSLVALAQTNLRYRLLEGFALNEDAPVNKGKPTLFVFEQAETFKQVFKPAPGLFRRTLQPNFGKEMVVGIALPPTNTPPKLSVSRIFVQDSILTVRYIRLKDTTQVQKPESVSSQPMLVVAIPKQTVLKTRLVENGRVVQTIRKREDEE